MRILLWNVVPEWTAVFTAGSHEYVVLDPAGPGTPPPQIDVAVVQRPTELDLVRPLIGCTPGAEIPAVYVEHHLPAAGSGTQRHPLADRRDITVVHRTAFSRLIWDNGVAPTVVIEPGIADPGPRYSGEIAAGVTVLDDPAGNVRAGGADLITVFAEIGRVELFGARTGEFVADLPGGIDVVGHGAGPPTDDLLWEIARRRVYLQPSRWTPTPTVALIEAMQMGMPVLAVSTAGLAEMVPADAGIVSADVDRLRREFRMLLGESEIARFMGRQARRAALARYGSARFLDEWDAVLTAVAGR